ncbi:E3 ubiquitin-protein ligase RING1-like [Cardamine amara subsp. amara]|uniref:RING-type E3 ubiquitin transferase n=1 Tax=Cardamine amara subsp. amara TaxID=228776 RepID=A0ABD1AIF9_CARAN
MSSAAKLFGCSINVEAEEEGGGGDSSIAREVSRSGNQPDGEAMSMFDCFPPFNQREIGNFDPCFLFPESNSDSGSAFVDSEPEFIDFFDRESYEVDTISEFYIRPNERVSSSSAFDLWEIHETEEDIELGLGIGSGSGQSRGVGNHREIDYLSTVGEAMVVDEEVEREDLQNTINWVPEASRNDEDEDLVDWQVLVAEDIMVGATVGLMDLDLGVYLDTIDEDYGDYFNTLIGQMFDNEDGGIMGSPPASKTVVDDLPVVEITSEELSNGNVIVCAICKDDVLVEEKVKKLPCKHYYHGECIIPWLGIRNTCPVCRYELPTDDLEYEMIRRLQRPR